MEFRKNCCVKHIHEYGTAHGITMDVRREEEKDSKEKTAKVKKGKVINFF